MATLGNIIDARLILVPPTGPTGTAGAAGSSVIMKTVSDILTGKDTSKVLTSGNLVTDPATIVWNMSTSYNIQVTLAGNRAFGHPTNAIIDRTYLVQIIQDANGF
jgi:hypothetical protein